MTAAKVVQFYKETKVSTNAYPFHDVMRTTGVLPAVVSYILGMCGVEQLRDCLSALRA